MSRKYKIGVVGLLVVGVLVATMAGTALAQDTTPTPAPKAFGFHGWGRGAGCGGLCGQAGLEAAAEALGMTADELSTQLWGGKTLADLADEAGVDLQDVRDAVDAACQQAIRDAIEQAVQDGIISRDQADWLLEGLDNGYWGGRGFFGFGHGFRHGFGRRFGGGGMRWSVPEAPGAPVTGNPA
ncbi:MAG: hypothetical protein D6791_02725 [Chloroflexi bacterium]|nr:MAG: hypothetical protein D6791_02725 [Chloroflexota bacterium]